MTGNQQFYLGVDVSKLWFDVSLLKVVDHQKQTPVTGNFENSPKGIAVFNKWLKSHKITFDTNSLLVMENTGIYHRALWAYCSSNNLPIHIGNAMHIKHSFGIARGKNDKIDSLRLCEYAYMQADKLKAAPKLDPILLQLKDLMTMRTKLIIQRNSIKTSLNELQEINTKGSQKIIADSLTDVLKGLDRSIKKIMAQIKKIVTENAAIRENYKRLISVPGIGQITALYIISCTNNFICKVTGKQLACYAGVVPFEHQSGTSVKKRKKVHHMANKDLKKLLHMGALAVIQHSPEFKAYYERKTQEGKHKMSILNAIRNKIILRAAAVINNKKNYVENFNNNNQKNMEKALAES